jgi:hypothetical protein
MLLSFSRYPWKKERGAILLFCPGHHTWPLHTASRRPAHVLLDSDDEITVANINATAYTPKSQTGHNTSAHRTRRTRVRRPGLRVYSRNGRFCPPSTTQRTWTEVPANRAPSGWRRSLSGKRPGVTGGRWVTLRSVAAPPRPPGSAGCRWLRTHHSSRLPARYGWQGHLRSRTVPTHKKKAIFPKG